MRYLRVHWIAIVFSGPIKCHEFLIPLFPFAAIQENVRHGHRPSVYDEIEMTQSMWS